MKKRLRKKKFLGEFAEFGVPVAVMLKEGTDFDTFFDLFLEKAVGKNHCGFYGGGNPPVMSGFVELGQESNAPLQKQQAIADWLGTNEYVANYVFGNVTDAWYGPFETYESIEKRLNE